ncbi:MAG TPA: transketolase, partial [Candidatus Parcubacteria bacterium]|nr:transketolase [Candidatus Parcubacteria bacterium]
MEIDYQKLAKELRKRILEMIFQSRSEHIGSSFSCVDILSVLYLGNILNVNPQNPEDPNRDRFILSKGHAAAALYVVLSKKGFFPEDILNTYYKDGSKLGGHVTRGFLPGIEASTGALGHGLPIGAGMALAAENDSKKYRVFVMLSDGECQEGSIWEAALFSSHHQLDNLIVIIDYNKIQAFGETNKVLNLEPLRSKWENFGWEVKEIDGHNFSEIKSAFQNLPLKENKPTLIIAHT